MSEISKFGVPGSAGVLQVFDRQSGMVFEIDGNLGRVSIGTKGNSGQLEIHNDQGKSRVSLQGDGAIVVNDENENQIFRFTGGELIVGGKEAPANLLLQGAAGTVMLFSAVTGRGTIGGSGTVGNLSVVDAAGEPAFQADASEGAVVVGSKGKPGRINVTDDAGRSMAVMGSGTISLGNRAETDMPAVPGDLYIGGGGFLRIADAQGVERVKIHGGEGTVSFRDEAGNETVGFNCASGLGSVNGLYAGSLVVRSDDGASEVNIGSSGRIRCRDAQGNETFHLDSDGADLYIGGNGNENGGDLVLSDSTKTRIHLLGKSAEIKCYDSQGRQTLGFHADNNILNVGGGEFAGALSVLGPNGRAGVDLVGDGRIVCHDSSGAETFSVAGEKAELQVGGNQSGGAVVVRDATRTRIHLDARTGAVSIYDSEGIQNLFFSAEDSELYIGGTGDEHGGNLSLRDARRTRVKLEANAGAVTCYDSEGTPTLQFLSQPGHLYIGGNSSGGQIAVRDAEKRLRLQLDGNSGDLYAYDSAGKQTLHFSAEGGDLYVGGNGNPHGGDVVVSDANRTRVQLFGAGGYLQCFDKDGAPIALLGQSGDFSHLSLGGAGSLPGQIVLRRGNYQDSITMDAESGDITLHNADCAEDFDVDGETEPGSVLTLTDEGTLETSFREYDTRVAGIAAGAGDYRPAIILDRHPSAGRRRPVTLVGKAFCKADASRAPIGVGDLLTTADRPGHAMKATDRTRAFGAVLGKALAPLQAGQGLIPVLVALQ